MKFTGRRNPMMGDANKEESLTEPLVGFKAVLFSESSNLRSTMDERTVYKKNNVEKAICLNRRDVIFPFNLAFLHKAPYEGCTCGLHGFFNLEEGYINHSLIKVVVKGWGHTFLHEEGFRSEYMEIIGIVSATNKPTFPNTSMTYDLLLEGLSCANKIPIVPEAHAKEFAKEHGNLITPEQSKQWAEEAKPLREKKVESSKWFCALYFVAYILAVFLIPDLPGPFITDFIMTFLFYWYLLHSAFKHLRVFHNKDKT